jgi:hypothetical protein
MSLGMAAARLARIALIVLVAVGGFAITYALTTSSLAALIWASFVSPFVLLLPFRAGGGTTNMTSILAGEPFALTERGRERMGVAHVTREERREAFVVFGVLLTLPFAALLLWVVSGG